MTALDPAPLDPADIRPRYRGYAGFITTPKYFDDSPQQFLAVAPDGVGVIQRVLHVPDYAFELEDRTRNFGLLEEAAECLADSHCQVLGQVGSNWVHCTGTTPDEIARFCDDLGERVGARFLMAGHCIVEALRSLGAKRIAVSNAYYRDDWRDGINRYLEQAGFEILSSGHMRDQGLYASLEEQLEVEDLSVWDHPDRDVLVAMHVKQLEAVSKLQQLSGMYLQVMDFPGSFQELTATCMIGYAMARGMRRGWLDSSYRASVELAWQGVSERIDDEAGLVDPCDGTGTADNVRFYLDRPAVFGFNDRGGSMAIWFATELELLRRETA